MARSFATLRMTEGIFMDSDSGSRCESGLYVIVIESDLVESRAGALGRVAETAAEPAVRIVRRAGIELQLSGSWHYENIPEVRMACAAEMGVTESDDRGIIVTVAGAGLIDHRLVFSVNIVGDRVGVRAKLDSAKRHTGPGEGMTHTICADKRIHIAGFGLRRDREG